MQKIQVAKPLICTDKPCHMLLACPTQTSREDPRGAHEPGSAPPSNIPAAACDHCSTPHSPHADQLQLIHQRDVGARQRELIRPPPSRNPPPPPSTAGEGAMSMRTTHFLWQNTRDRQCPSSQAHTSYAEIANHSNKNLHQNTTSTRRQGSTHF